MALTDRSMDVRADGAGETTATVGLVGSGATADERRVRVLSATGCSLAGSWCLDTTLTVSIVNT
jgi:hypothetical protein